MGYPAAGMRNYLARLGWSHGDDEFFSDAQAQEWFDLDGIGKSPARFDIKKLENICGQHIAVAMMLHCCTNCKLILRRPAQPLTTHNLRRAERACIASKNAPRHSRTH